MRVMFYCQHLVGIGHLVRSSAIVRALARRFSVLFVTGGPPVSGFELPAEVEVMQLPPLQTDPKFERLETCDPSVSLEETQARRIELLLGALDSFRPDALITELYPFGRKQFDFELVPLLEKARNKNERIAIVSSVRDVLVMKRDQARHEERVSKLIQRYFSLVLVHGDERFQRLDETFHRAGELACPVIYTGYVVQPERDTGESGIPGHGSEGCPFIVSSAGAGRFPGGHRLEEAVIRAAMLLQDRIPHEIRVFAGPLAPPEAYRKLEEVARGSRNVELRRHTPTLTAYLRCADLSLSLGGYNTVMEILSTGVRALVLPITSNDDQEQSIRAAALERLGVLKTLCPQDLEPGRLAEAIYQGLQTKPTSWRLNMNGAENSALALEAFLGDPSVIGVKELEASLRCP